MRHAHQLSHIYNVQLKHAFMYVITLTHIMRKSKIKTVELQNHMERNKK